VNHPLQGYTAEQVRAAERPLLDAGVPLMRRAATALAAELRALARRTVLALVGPGDNGGDALFAVAELAGEGIIVTVVPVADRMHEAAAEAARAAGVRFADAGDAAALAASADAVVDGILGIGSTGPLRGTARATVAALLPALDRESRPVVVAVDLPSGVGADDGTTDGLVLPADLTVTFGAVKAGLLLEPGSRYAGRVVLVDLGLRIEGPPTVVG